MQTVNLTLCCWVCGKTKDIIAPNYPQFSFELAGFAKDVGWIGILDYYHKRSLVLCSEKCLNASKTKNGGIRFRPPKIPK